MQRKVMSFATEVDNPENTNCKKLISDIDFFSKEFNVPREVLDTLVCTAYYLGKTSATRDNVSKLKDIITR